MERLAIKELIKWNEAKNRKPLIVYGARQVGKTYLIKQLFAERYYKNKFIYVDLKKDDDVREFILSGGKNGSSIVDANKIIEYLSLSKLKKIEENTLLIFDEAQECLPIITSLKYFKQDRPEIPVIVSGSMVRIKIKREQKKDNQHKKEGLFFPVGSFKQITIFPISFEEFLLNYNESLYNKVVEAYKQRVPLPPELHDLAMNALYIFLLVGGMPETLSTYLSGKDLLSARDNTESIFKDYLGDMELYQVSNESIIRSKTIFETIYSQLDKESKNFKSSLIGSGLKNRDIKNPKDWLILSNTIYESKQIKQRVTIPLKEDDENNYRLYLFDNGLFTYQSHINMSSFVNSGTQNTLFGILFENYIATELASKKIPLFYWKGKNASEFEFLVESCGTIIPIDVKKGVGTLTSLKNYSAFNKCPLAIKISKNNFGYNIDNKILTIPLYQAFLLIDDLISEKIDYYLQPNLEDVLEADAINAGLKDFEQGNVTEGKTSFEKIKSKYKFQ